MLKNPKDKRAQRTSVQIKDTMLICMETKAIHEIKVSEICKICQINRATFYDHYKDVFDLVQDMENDMILLLQDLMLSVSPEDTPAPKVSHLFFHFIEKHRKTLKLLISSERGLEFRYKLNSQLMPFFEKKIRQNYDVPENCDFDLQCAMQFVGNGYYHFFFKAINEDIQDIKKEAELCVKLSNASLEAMFKPKFNTDM